MLKAFLVALAIPTLLLAEEPKKPEAAAKPAATAELKVGTALENRDLTGAAEEFKVAPDTKLYVWAKVSGVPADGKVTLGFWKGDKQAYKLERSVSGSPYRLNAYKTFRAGDSGDWTAKAVLADGTELASAKFKVEVQK